MSKHEPKESDSNILRQKAEALFREKSLHKSSELLESEKLRLIHELEVHQIQLELQNQELRIAKEQLKITAERYTQLYDFAPLGYFTLTKNARIHEANLEGARLLGKPRSKIINSQFNFFISDDTKPIFNQFLSEAFLNHNKRECNIILPGKDKDPTFIHLSGLVPEEGEYCNIILFDVTEKILQEQALRDSEELYRITMENIHDPVFITDDDGNFTFVCANVKYSLGYTKNEINEIGNIKKLIGDDCFDIRKLTTKENTLTIERSLSSKEGDELHFSITISKVAIQGGTTLYVFHDISEQKKVIELQLAHLRLVNYAAEHDVKALLRKFLDETEILTQSNIGFYHFVEDDQETISLQTWSSNTQSGICKVPKLDHRQYPISQAGIRVDCVLKMKPVIHNDYDNESGKKGLPDGHVPLVRELVVPVIRNGKVKAILGVGNKQKKYTRGDISIVQQLADFAWETVSRKIVEQAVKESEAKFSSIFDQSPVGSVIVGLDKRFIKSNQAFCNFIGYAEAELQGRLISDITHPEDIEIGMNELKQLREGKIESCKLQKRYIHKAGQIVWGEISLCVIKDSSGKPLYFLPVIKDITLQLRAEEQRRAAQQELKKSESHARALIDAIPDMMFRIDKHGNFIDYEAAQNQLYHIDETIIGKNCLEIFPPELAAITLERIGIAIKTGQIQVYEYQLTTSGNSPSYFEARMVPASSSEVVVIVRDVSIERKNANELLVMNQKLKSADAEKDKFFSIIAHDLKSPFNVFLGATELIKNEFDVLSYEQIQSLIGSLHGSAKKLYELLENLLEWSRMQRGVFPFEPGEISLLDFMTETLELSIEMAERKNIDFEIYIPAEIEVFADAKMLNSLMRNLSSNAIKFTNPGGKIVVTAKTMSNNLIEVSIRDNGIGIPPDTMEKLFSLTENISRPGTHGEPSVGLGLLLCSEFAKWHGSEINVESEEGKGSKFSFKVSQNGQNKH